MSFQLARAITPLILLLSLNASAIELTWKQSLQLVSENNAELEAARLQLEATRRQEGVTRSNFLPHVSASLSGSESKTGSNDQVTSYGAQLNLTQNLFAGFSDWTKWNQNQAETRAAEETQRITKARISAELKQAYQGLTYAQELSRMTSQIAKRREDNLRMVELRFNSGRENKGSVLLSKANHNQAKYDDLQAKFLLKSSMTSLAKVLGIRDDQNLVLLDAVPVNDPGVEISSATFEKIAEQSPQVKQSLAQAEASRHAYDSTKGAFLPSLDLSGSTGNTDSVFYPRGEDAWNARLTLTIPLFDGGRDWSSMKASSARMQSSEQNARHQFRDALLQLRQAYAEYVSAVEKTKVDESFRRAAEVRAEIARNKYNNGLMTFEDWDQVENDLTDRQRKDLTSRRDRVTQESKWEQTQGIGVIP